ncbi:MAG TPA: DUF4331 domain-containing protein [Solirubrobacteraceae bacterium]|nr:DUF4331 domain-containing protein [Solirubrobacteraceae bacterium]
MASRRRTALAAATLAALGTGGALATLGQGSSHREAPLTALDPAADDTDVYAFTADDAPGDLTVIANWIPFEDPAGGPNFYRFDDRARYYVNVDNTGDGAYDVRYRFRFKTQVRNPDSFLYALPGVTSIADPKLNVVQTYTVTRLRYGRKGRKLRSSQVLGRNVPVAPANVGPKTIPDYASVAAEAIQGLAGGGRVFAGPVDDPFFVDLGGTFDAINIREGTGAGGGGRDDVAGYNVHTIALQVPEAAVTRDGSAVAGPDAGNAVVGVWASTERPKVKVLGRGRKAERGTVQVSRLGNPLVNEVVIPLGKKDFFNATQPSDDLANFGAHVLEPELAKVINILFPGLDVPETDRTDIVQALLTGIPGLTQIAPGAVPADTLKINLGVAPNPDPNRFGVLAGDTAGFPNGRRLADDVVDIELRVIGGFLKGNKLPLGDGVDRNDQPFRSTFPYVAPPVSGFDGATKRTEPTHDPTPAQP